MGGGWYGGLERVLVFGFRRHGGACASARFGGIGEDLSRRRQRVDGGKNTLERGRGLEAVGSQSIRRFGIAIHGTVWSTNQSASFPSHLIATSARAVRFS